MSINKIGQREYQRRNDAIITSENVLKVVEVKTIGNILSPSIIIVHILELLANVPFATMTCTIIDVKLANVDSIWMTPED